MSGRLIMLLVLLLGSYLSTAAMGGPAQALVSREDARFFERKIRPVLIERCYACHSSAKADGQLRLDTAEGLTKGGAHGPVLRSDQPLSSPILQALRKPHPDNAVLRSPPAPIGVLLDFQAWVKAGAPDPRRNPPPPRPAETGKHWAFQPLTHPTPPSVRDLAWIKDPIDRFVLARLEAHHLRPAPPADRETLLRRASFDLTGLPPSVAELEAFLADRSPEAFAHAVDRLLQSPQFGEHWGRLWLRTIQYADSATAGVNAVYENAWRYRDYVIGAFKDDKPFDEFIREQLAGDLLRNRSSDPAQQALIATGFLVLGPKVVLDPSSRNLALDIADEQLDLVSRTFLGLTVCCARCHDHKTDPITLRDYSALAGIFTSTSTFEVGEGRRRGAPRRLARSLATPQQVEELREFETRFAELRDQLRAARERKMEVPGEVDSSQLSGVVVDNLAAEVHGAWKESNYSTNFVDRNYLHDGNADKGKKSVRYVPELPEAGVYEVLVSYTPRANRATNVPVLVQCADGLQKVTLDQTRLPDVDKVFASVGRFRFQAGTNGAVTISNEGTKGFVVADAVRFVPAGASAPAAMPSVARSEAETAFLSYRQLEKELWEMQGKRPVLPEAMAAQDGRIQECRLRSQAAPRSAGEPIPRGFPQVLGTPDSTLYAITDESSGRLELAYWLTCPENPLTARVGVNRLWGYLFGRGIVETVDDFGTTGALPDNPELLEHLAGRFRDQGWSVKKLLRAVLLSSTYQMSSRTDQDGAVADPENRWLAHANVRLLEPEVLRDAVLSISGDLVRTAGGPWAEPNEIQREGIAAASRAQRTSLRRSVYLPVLPGTRPQVLRLLDAAKLPNAPPAKRTGADAAQDEVIRNGFLSGQARIWARKLQSVPQDEQRLSVAYRQALGRAPSPEEMKSVLGKLEAAGKLDDPDAKMAAWSDFFEQLLGSPEFRSLP